MAVVNDYVNSLVAADKLTSAFDILGAEVICAATTFEVAAADDDGSIYRLFKGLSPNLVPVRIEILNDALTGSTDWDLGFYESLNDLGVGPVIDKDILYDGFSMASARVSGAGVDGLTSVDVADRCKNIMEICGHTAITKKMSYDLALTANTVGSGAGTVTVIAWFARKV